MKTREGQRLHEKKPSITKKTKLNRHEENLQPGTLREKKEKKNI